MQIEKNNTLYHKESLHGSKEINALTEMSDPRYLDWLKLLRKNFGASTEIYVNMNISLTFKCFFFLKALSFISFHIQDLSYCFNKGCIKYEELTQSPCFQYGSCFLITLCTNISNKLPLINTNRKLNHGGKPEELECTEILKERR